MGRQRHPFQLALTTKSGCECIAHIAQALTDLDANATLLSVDGIGAFDLISRSAMLQGLLEVDGGGSVLPFVRQFYGSPSTCWWDDDEGVTHEIVEGEAGEQGDPLMPALFALGQHEALVAVSERLLPTERLLAFHDDLYVHPHCSPAGLVGALKDSSSSRQDPALESERRRFPEGGVHSKLQLGRSTRTQSCGAEILNSFPFRARGESAWHPAGAS